MLIKLWNIFVIILFILFMSLGIWTMIISFNLLSITWFLVTSGIWIYNLVFAFKYLIGEK